MPADALDTRMRLIQQVDASTKIINQACWAGFKMKNGNWSCQQLLARSLLAPKNSTIPKSELQALTNGSNMCWILRKMLDDWVSEYIICSDSAISLCWVTAEKKSLSLFHRNRVIQVRRGTDINYLYHVKTEENLADLGTRPDKVKVTDVGPDSEWEHGKLWMQREISEAIEQGILKQASTLRLNPENNKEFEEGLVFGGKSYDLFCNAVTMARVEKLRSRVEFSNYLVNPAKYNFRKLVRIHAIVLSFIRRCRKQELKCVKVSGDLGLSTFASYVGNSHSGEVPISSLGVSHIQDSSFTDDIEESKKSKPRVFANITDEDLQSALVYLFRKATKEVEKFNSKVKVEKAAVMKDDILFSRGRILEGMNFEQTGGISVTGLGELGIKALTPVIDRHSPLAYCIATHIHWNIAQHKGVETCYRISLQHVTILQGASLFKELSDECIRCRMKRKKYVDMPMGLLSEHRLKICPPFWVTQMDLFGPVPIYVPGLEKNTRTRVLRAECHVLVFACPVTRLINLQVVEKRDGSGVMDGITRLSCEVGIPKLVLMDQDAAFIKSLKEVEYSYTDAEFNLNRDLGIEFITCPVSGHNQNGQVERRIRTVQESLREAGLESKKLHATGLQTMLKLVENQVNNLPLGFSFGRDHDNTPLMKLISPNMLRVGRNNARALNGPFRLPKPGELLEKVQDMYSAWFKIWATTYISKIMFKPKWWNQETCLNEEDVVLFKKKDSVLEDSWTLGTIEQLVRGRDGHARRAIVRYQNKNEDGKRTTDRHVRSLVKIWSVDDQNFHDDLVELERLLKSSSVGTALLGQISGEDLVTLECHVGRSSNDDGIGCCTAHFLTENGVQDQDKLGDVTVQKRYLPYLEIPESWIEMDLVCDEDEVMLEEDEVCEHDMCLETMLSSLELNLY